MTASTLPDSDELEALFDSIAAQSSSSASAPRVPAPAPAAAGGDTDELEALFEQAAAEYARTTDAPGPAPAAPADDGDSAVLLFHRVGQLTRTLHDALRELGYDRKIARAADCLPDARDRLRYIATLTGQAAERVLGAVEAAQAEQQALETGSLELVARWSELYANRLSVEEFKVLAGETRSFLAAVPARVGATRKELHAMMMAQDFHDLTGQVIRKVVDLAATLETSLVALLVETRNEERRPERGWLNGPAVRTDSPDIVKDQREVDALLESLGF